MAESALYIEPVEKKINQTTVRLEKGDLTKLEVDAFVFYARNDLELGSGFGTAIQSRGGDSIKKELAAIGGIRAGEVAITRAGNLPAKFILHACGPKFQEADTEAKLRDCMRSTLFLADRQGIKTMAFPPMGAGFYGVPLPLCAEVMWSSIQTFLKEKNSLETIVLCVIDRREFAAFQQKMETLIQ